MTPRKKHSVSPEREDQLVEILRAVDLFASASDDDLRDLASEAREREVAEGAQVVREGRLPTHVYVVVEGRFEVVSRGEKDDQPQVVNTLGPGDHFGEIGLIEGMPATATVRARGRAKVAEIPGRAFLQFVDRSASLGEVADRISMWLARTHPSYRPSAAGGTSRDPGERRLLELIAGWDPSEIKMLETAVERLSGLAPGELRDRLQGLGR
jgi:CRP-like cAMP-binding protein